MDFHLRKCSEGDSALTGDAQSNSGFERLSPQATSSSKTKNFDKASSESETQECSKEKILEVKSSLENGEKETKYNPGHEKAISAFDSNACGVSERETSLGDYSVEDSSCSEGRGTACSQKKVRRKSKYNQVSCAKLKDERRMSVSALKCSDSVGNPRVNLDDRPSGKSTLNHPGDEFQEPIDQLASRNPDARSFEDIVELDCGVCLASKDSEHDEAHDSVQANGTKQNESDGYKTNGSNADKEKGKKGSTKRSNSQSESFIRRKSRRKSLYNSERESLSQRNSMRKMDGLISEKEKEESSIMSPESLCLKKSRSGRWLLPTLEFWRNQRVIYDADHRIRGIKDLS